MSLVCQMWKSPREICSFANQCTTQTWKLSVDCDKLTLYEVLMNVKVIYLFFMCLTCKKENLLVAQVVLEDQAIPKK